ncbi:MAG: transporter, partial [Thermoplasmata archaeon]|nr:transporter [Thermoplasmata archaeon]NIT79789.1 transporter [Thermoplasmata archaeon]NIY06157.1 transporter [Thermoplasmata archaeon]
AGTDDIESGRVIDPAGFGFPVTPVEMPTQTHMFGIMFAPTDRITVVGMLPITTMEMDNVTREGGTFTTESSGVGDSKLAGLWMLDPTGDQRVHVMLVVGIPSGATGKNDVTPLSDPREARLPYPMQTGTGTWNLSPGLTYLGQAGEWSWGGQALPTFRLGDNERDYRFGHQYMATAWGARRL